MTSRGRGTIQCAQCKKPLRDHDRIGPCPAFGVNLIHVSPAARGQKTDPASVRARERKRLQRQKQRKEQQ